MIDAVYKDFQRWVLLEEKPGWVFMTIDGLLLFFWSDGTTGIKLSPSELIEKLLVLIPPVTAIST
jgi:hypothetical protein